MSIVGEAQVHFFNDSVYQRGFCVSELDRIPFVWRGRDRAVGLDCFGFASVVNQFFTGQAFHEPEELVALYNANVTEYEVPPFFAKELAEKLLQKRAPGEFIHLDLVILQSARLSLLGTYIRQKDQALIAAMSPGGSFVLPLPRLQRTGLDLFGVFDPEPLRAPLS